MASLEELIVGTIDKLSTSTDLLSSEDLATKAKRHTLRSWRNLMIAKVTAVGFLTGLPGGCAAWVLTPIDLAYLFAAAGRACYGIGHILGRDVERETDLRLILAIWCGAAEAVAGVTAGKAAIKVLGKAALPTMAGFAAKVLAKSAVKGGGKMITKKLLPQLAAKVAGQFAGKAGAMMIPILGGVVSAAISYWVAASLMDAAERYYRHEYVEFTGGDLTAAELMVDVIGDSALSGGADVTAPLG